MALGNYHDAMVAAIQFIDEETRLMSADPTHRDDHNDRVLNGHYLWRDAADAAGLRAEVLRAMENGARFIDRESEPVLWADFHETIAKDYLKYAQLKPAEDLIDAILDIREEHQPEPSVELAKSLLLWCSLLKAKAAYEGCRSVAQRAERIFAQQTPPHMPGVSASLDSQASSLRALGSYVEAEAAVPAGAGHQRGQLWPRPPGRGARPEQPGPVAAGHRPAG